MRKKIDLRGTIWHEIGHLCLDILMCEKYNEYCIDELNINFGMLNNIPKWGGSVTIKPSYKYTNIQDLELFNLNLVGVISGCVFETHFYNNILDGRSKHFADFWCANISCSGFADRYNFSSLLKSFEKNYMCNLDFDFWVEKEFVPAYLSFLKNNEDFSKQIEMLVCVIIEDMEQNINPEGVFSYKDDKLESLIIDVQGKLEETRFLITLDEILEKTLQKLKNTL